MKKHNSGAPRADRVADLIRRELGDILLTEVRDPRAQLASVAEVRVSRDLRHAWIGISVLAPAPDEEEDDARREEAIAALRSAGGFIRRALASRLSLRTVPELRFELYRGAEHSQRITELLADLVPPEETAGPSTAPTRDDEEG